MAKQYDVATMLSLGYHRGIIAVCDAKLPAAIANADKVRAKTNRALTAARKKGEVTDFCAAAAAIEAADIDVAILNYARMQAMTFVQDIKAEEEESRDA